MRCETEVQMHVATKGLFVGVAFACAVVYSIDTFNVLRHLINTGIMKFVTAQHSSRRAKAAGRPGLDFPVAETGPGLLHMGLDREGTDHTVQDLILIDDAFSEIHKTATFRIDRAIVFNPFPDRSYHQAVIA